MSRQWNVTVSDLQELHRKSISLLEMLKTHFPDRVGGAQGWNFEKAHSILHKVREIVLWGWSENTSCQDPEHAHIDIIKSVAHLTNNKDVFFAFCAITAAVDCCSSTNSCWRTWLARVRLMQFKWIKLEWKRP